MTDERHWCDLCGDWSFFDHDVDGGHGIGAKYGWIGYTMALADMAADLSLRVHLLEDEFGVAQVEEKERRMRDSA